MKRSVKGEKKRYEEVLRGEKMEIGGKKSETGEKEGNWGKGGKIRVIGGKKEENRGKLGLGK